jgi:hypothetical protein
MSQGAGKIWREHGALQKTGKIPSTKGELPEVSVFLRQGEEIFHSYSTCARGLDPLLATYQLLDLTPFGRGEGWGGVPDLRQGMEWLGHHDKYDDVQSSSCCYAQPKQQGQAALCIAAEPCLRDTALVRNSNP